ncbi:MAG: YncE family protein [Verrucomicrobiota bacterium]
MRRYLTLLMLLSCWDHIQAADLPRKRSYTLESIVHTAIPRAADLAMAPNGATAVTCMDLQEDGFLKFDAASGELLSRHLKRDFNPQRVFWHGKKLLLLTDTNRKPEFRVLDCQSFERLNTFTLPDWRLYRITSAALTSDGSQIWMGTMPTSSSLYGEVDSGLFCLSVSNGVCLQVAGNPPDKKYVGHFRERRIPWMVCANDTGGIIAIDPENKSIISYSTTHKDPSRLVQLDFTPTALPRKCSRYLPVAGEDHLHVMDLKTGKSVGELTFTGRPLAVCVDAAGTMAFVSTADSSILLQFDLPSLKKLQPIDLSRPKGIPDIADAARGKDVSDLVELRWACNPDRLIAFGYDGYIFIIATVQRKE